MAQTPQYTLDSFIDEIRQVFATTQDPRQQAEQAAGHMQRLLVVPGLGTCTSW